MTNWQLYREPLSITLARTVGIALVAGAVLAHWWGGLGRWPLATALMLWPSFGGHWLELWFLNWLRPRLPDTQREQIAVRLVVWFIGGVGLAVAMRFTAIAFTDRRPAPWATWWMAGLAFIGIELVAHLVLQVRGRPSFFNGRSQQEASVQAKRGLSSTVHLADAEADREAIDRARFARKL